MPRETPERGPAREAAGGASRQSCGAGTALGRKSDPWGRGVRFVSAASPSFRRWIGQIGPVALRVGLMLCFVTIAASCTKSNSAQVVREPVPIYATLTDCDSSGVPGIRPIGAIPVGAAVEVTRSRIRKNYRCLQIRHAGRVGWIVDDRNVVRR